MNINSIHAYEGINGKNRRSTEKENRGATQTHPLSVSDYNAIKQATDPSFKGINWSALGRYKEWIDNAGFFIVFIIQDVIGMTLPRTWTGLNRDKEITGKYHYQEAKEVLGREGLTGPAMMAIPGAVFVGTALAMGKSTKTNSRLIRTLGNSFKELAAGLTKETKPTEAKVAFYEKNFKQLFKETLGFEAADDVVKNVKDKFANLEKIKELKATGEKKQFSVADIEAEFGFGIDKVKSFLKNESLAAETTLDNSQMSTLYKKMQKELGSDIPKTIQNSIDDALLNMENSDLSKLNKIKFDGNTYSVGDATDAMIRYADDIVTRNKKYSEMTEANAEDFKNSMLGKRCVSNLAAIAAVLGIMNYLPRLYARSNTPPGEASKAMAACREKEESAKCQKGDVAFTGLFSSLGKKISKLGDTTLAEGEFHGINFTPTLMTGISILGLTYPRAKRAYDRAPEKDPAIRQNEGWFSSMFKKDASEIKEIAVRDPISALSVTFAVPLLTRWMVKLYEKTTGFVLMNNPENVNGFKKFLAYINPYSSVEVLDNAQLNALYGKIDSQERLVNVCNYLDRKGGDLEKIFSKAEDKAKVFNESTFTLASIREMKVKEKNAKIIDLIKKAKPEECKNIIESLLPTAEKLSKNKALAAAKAFNSIPFFLNLIIVSPILLGWGIPKYTYKLTREASDQAKKAAAQNQQIQQQAQEVKPEKVAVK